MKLKLTIAAAIMALNVASQAATYTVSNVGDGTTDILLQDGLNVNSTVKLLDGGVVALGYFAAGYSFPTLANAQTAVSAFTLVTSAIAGTYSDTLGASLPGYVEGAQFQGATIATGNALAGRALYVFAGNASTLAGSTRFGLQQVASIQLDEPLELGYSVTLAGAPAPIYGTIGSYTGDAAGQGSNTYSTLNLANTVSVPETSSALLGAMGALGLLRRRRN